MKIDFGAMKENGFEVVPLRDGGEVVAIEIYPKNGSSRVFDLLFEVLKNSAQLHEREANQLADSFAAQVHVAQVWQVIRNENM